MAEIIVALDFASTDEAMSMVDRLGSEGDFYKVGLELFTRAGPDFVRSLTQSGRRVFLDLKLHDIPNTVVGGVSAAADLGVELLTVHCSGGRASRDCGTTRMSAWNTGWPTLPALRTASAASRQQRIEVSV